MDNLGCVFIMGRVVPPFATGGRAWGEFVSGGSPNEELQQLAIHLLVVQIEHGFPLTFEWVPRDRNVRADYLSHVSAMQHHHYRLLREWFEYLDGLWGLHSIDRFATAENRQRLYAPNTGRFRSHYFYPDGGRGVDGRPLYAVAGQEQLAVPPHVRGRRYARAPARLRG